MESETMPNLKDLQAQVNEEVEYEGQLKQTVSEGLTEEKQSHSKPIAQSVWDEIVNAGETVPNNMIFCGLVGPEGVGKTGIVLDSMDEESKKRGDVIFVLDFDGGGQTTRVTHHREHANNIRCLNPNVMFETFDEDGEIREAIDYPATHRRVMKIGQTLVDWAARPGDKPRLHSVLITAVDLWDEVAKNCMFIEDLGTAPDGIGAKVKPHEQIGMRFNWQIRTTRFHQLTTIARTLMSLGVNVYFETHFKDLQDKTGSVVGKKAAWEKHTANYLNQVLYFHKKKVRDENGKSTGETRYEVEFVKCKTNPDLLDQRRTIMVTKEGQPLEWYGLPELREGQV
tara:strand:- start:6227 stop:7246 length:1020 start_codon:yes stop_codon:yes gene_type:complete